MTVIQWFKRLSLFANKEKYDKSEVWKKFICLENSVQTQHTDQICHIFIKKKLKFFYKICEELKLFFCEDKNQIYTELTNYDLV